MAGSPPGPAWPMRLCEPNSKRSARSKARRGWYDFQSPTSKLVIPLTSWGKTARFRLPPEPGLVLSARERSGRELAGGGRELPAGAGNIARFDIDVFFEPHQFPVAGARGEGVAGFAGETDHGVVGAQCVAEQVLGAERSRAAFENFQQRLADAVALPAVVDRQAEFD